jgi:ADP-ribose pyrophosphatase YjhB (NUDIX family)
MIIYGNIRKNKKVYIDESRLYAIDEASRRESPVFYSMDDEIRLSEDPLARLEREKQSGKPRNFAIERNGKQYWVARSSIVTLYVFCKNHNNEWCVLASQRGPIMQFPGKWNVTCGFLDYGETLEDAAVRECYEECGINVKGTKIFNCGTDSSNLNGSVNHDFACILNGVIDQYPPSMENCEGYGTDMQEVQNVRWIPISQLNSVDIRYIHKRKAKELINSLAQDSQGGNTKKLLDILQNMVISNEISNEKYVQIINILNKQ